MTPEDAFLIGDEVRLWLDPGGGITLRAVTPDDDPVELSSTEARRRAGALARLADQDEAD